MGERGYGIRSGVNRQGWEQSDFPILCEQCLGENPYIRMTRSDYGRECKVCTRPFTLFKWKAGIKNKYKDTLICQTCAKLKNCCQSCVYDLQYHMPLEIRDKYLEEQKVDLPTSAPNRDFFVEQANKHIENLQLPYNTTDDQILSKLTRVGDTAGSFLETSQQLCQHFLKGTCQKGDNCLYKHDKILALQHQKMNRNRQQNINQKPSPPGDSSITTLIFYKIQNDITNEDIEKTFKPFGEIQQVQITGERGRVIFKQRGAAEAAFDALYNKLTINDKKLRLIWSKFQPGGNTGQSDDEDDGLLIPGQGFKVQKQKFIQKVTQSKGINQIDNKQTQSISQPSSKAPIPLLPPPNIQTNLKAQHSFLMNVITQGNNRQYPSMDPNHFGGIKRTGQKQDK